MTKYIVKRILLMFLTLFIIMTICFVLVKLLPLPAVREMGKDINLGCGVVFVNYDGKNKYRSVIKDGAFIGCNVNIVSPVTVGEKAYIGAATTVTKDVPDGVLLVGRPQNKTIPGWVERTGLLDKKKK